MDGTMQRRIADTARSHARRGNLTAPAPSIPLLRYRLVATQLSRFTSSVRLQPCQLSGRTWLGHAPSQALA
jgi:hypothetical protein